MKQLQLDLIDIKVDAAIYKATAPILEQLVILRQDLQKETSGLGHNVLELRYEMIERFADTRSVLTRLEPFRFQKNRYLSNSLRMPIWLMPLVTFASVVLSFVMIMHIRL